ncbi:unnamed protein product, partial [Phaeothamnion confervicola]
PTSSRNAASPAPAEAAVSSDSVSIGNSTPAAAPANAPAVSAEAPTAQPGPLKKWTVMVYSCSDNNLYRYMQEDLNEAEKVGTTDQLNVIAYTDHRPKGGNAGFYEVKTNDTPGFTSPVVQDRGNRNLSDPKELSEFIQWGMKNYPAENFMLIMSDHGAAWQGGMSDDGGGGHMTLPKIEEGLRTAREATGRQLDVLGFDACLMANVEVLHQLEDEAKFMVGSEETEGGAGWTYNRVLSKDMLAGSDMAMRSRLDYTPREMAEGVVRMAGGVQGDLPTMTAFDMSKVPQLSDAVNTFGNALLATNVSKADLSATANKTQGFAMEKDLHDFAGKIATGFGAADPALKEAAQGVQAAISNVIVAEQHSLRYPGAHGVTIELNKQGAGFT